MLRCVYMSTTVESVRIRMLSWPSNATGNMYDHNDYNSPQAHVRSCLQDLPRMILSSEITVFTFRLMVGYSLK